MLGADIAAAVGDQRPSSPRTARVRGRRRAQRSTFRCRLPSPIWPNSTGDRVGGVLCDQRRLPPRRTRRPPTAAARRRTSAAGRTRRARRPRIRGPAKAVVRSGVDAHRGLAGQSARREQVGQPLGLVGSPASSTSSSHARPPAGRRRGARRSARRPGRRSTPARRCRPGRGTRAGVDQRVEVVEAADAVTRCAGVGCSRRSRR